jgi:hypothetical protein
METLKRLIAGGFLLSAILASPLYAEEAASAQATRQAPKKGAVQEAAVAPNPPTVDPLSPAVLTRMEERENRMRKLDQEIRTLRPQIQALGAGLARDERKKSLTALENEYAKLHLGQVTDGLVWLPLQVPFGLVRGANRAAGRALGNPDSSGTMLRPAEAPGIAELREVLENASDLGAAAATVRRISRDMTESQIKKEQEIASIKQALAAEQASLEAEDKRLRAAGRSDREINLALGERDEAFDKQSAAARDRIAVLDAEREYLRTIKSSATMFLITHGAEIPSGMGLIGQGAVDMLAGNFAVGAAKMAGGVAIASPAGLDVGCWAGQCLVWGPTKPLVNSGREMIAAKGGAVIEKLLYDNAGKKSPQELIEMLTQAGATQVLSINSQGEKTSVTLLNKKGEKAVTLSFNLQANGEMHLEGMSVNKPALAELDYKTAVEEVGKLGWDVKDAFKHLMSNAMEPEMAKRVNPAGRSAVGSVVQPIINYFEGEEKGALPGFVKGDAIVEGDNVRYEIAPGKVQIAPKQELKPWLKKVAGMLAPAGRVLGPNLRDAWSAIGFGLEKTGHYGEVAITSAIEKGGQAQRAVRSVAAKVAEGPIGQACFAGWKALSLLNTK